MHAKLINFVNHKKGFIKMSIKVGDKVRFLNDVGGGVVTKLVDRFSVLVENETGFDVPVDIKEIVVTESIETYSENSAAASNSSQPIQLEAPVVDLESIFYPEIAEVEESGNKINVILAFVPQERPGNSNMDVFLINDSNYNILYSIINTNDLNETYSNSVGVLEANTKEQIESIGLSSLNQIPEYTFHLSFYRRGNFKVVPPVEKQIRINPVRFYKEKAYTENDFFHKNSILMPVISDQPIQQNKIEVTAKEIEKAIKEKDSPKTETKKGSRKEQENEILEVDLHIHELLDDFRGLTNSEMLEIQLKHFNSELKEALKKGPKKLVFIHGVGNGTLKTEIRRELDRMKGKLEFHDASFAEYGYGATMVKLK